MPKRKTSDKKFADLTQDIDLEKFKRSVQSDFADFPDPWSSPPFAGRFAAARCADVSSTTALVRGAGRSNFCSRSEQATQSRP